MRAAGGYDVARFSASLARALAAHDAIRSYSGVVVLAPEDPDTEQFLRSSVGGYFDVALRLAIGRSNIGGAVAYTGEPARDAGLLHLRCAYREGEVLLGR